MCLSRPTRVPGQRTITEWTSGRNTCMYNNIDPVGDPMLRREEDDGITRLGYQNAHTTTMGQGLDVAHEIEVTAELGVDVQGFSEINKPWTASNKWQYNYEMNLMFQNSHTVYSGMPAENDCTWQPGGNLMTVNGPTAGRIVESDTDKWG